MFDLLEFVFEIFGEAVFEGLARVLSAMVSGIIEMVRQFWWLI